MKTMVGLAALVCAAFPTDAQLVRIQFSSQVSEIVGAPLAGVTVGSVITGQAEVDLASLPADEDPSNGVGWYPYSDLAGGRPGFTMQFDTGLERIRYDSINAANDPGSAPGIYMRDETGAHDWLILQERDQGKPYGANLSFEIYTEPRTLLSADYFPEAVNLQAGLEKANFYYFDQSGANSLVAKVTSASMTIEPGGTIAALLAQRVSVSELPARQKRVLLRLLQASETALEQGRCRAALRNWRLLQGVARAQVKRTDPLLAGRLIAGAQAIINAGCNKERSLRQTVRHVLLQFLQPDGGLGVAGRPPVAAR